MKANYQLFLAWIGLSSACIQIFGVPLSWAETTNTTVIPPITVVDKLPSHAKSFVTLVFARTSFETMRTSGQKSPNLAEVAATETLPLKDGVAAFGQLSIKTPLDGGINVMIAVVHSQPTFYYQNPNGEKLVDYRLSAKDIPNPAELKMLGIKAIEKLPFIRIINKGEPVTIELTADDAR